LKSDELTQKIIDLGGLEYLRSALFHEKISMKKEACWIISNIAAGKSIHAQALIKGGFLPTLQSVFKESDLKVYLINKKYYRLKRKYLGLYVILQQS